MNKKEMIHIAEKIEQSIPDLRLAYARNMPSYTPQHNGFKNNLVMKLERASQNLKRYGEGEKQNVGEWYFDTLDLVNALTLVNMMKNDEESYKLIEEVCETLCSEYDEATGQIPQLKE